MVSSSAGSLSMKKLCASLSRWCPAYINVLYQVCSKEIFTKLSFQSVSMPLRRILFLLFSLCLSDHVLRMLSLLGLHAGFTFSPAVVAMVPTVSCHAPPYISHSEIFFERKGFIPLWRWPPTLEVRFVRLFSFFFFHHCFQEYCSVLIDSATF